MNAHDTAPLRAASLFLRTGRGRSAPLSSSSLILLSVLPARILSTGPAFLLCV